MRIENNIVTSDGFGSIIIKNLKNKLTQIARFFLIEKFFTNKNDEILLLKRVIDSVPGDIYWKDKNGIYLGINDRGIESLQKFGFSYTKDGIIGKTDYDLYDKETADAFRANDLEVIKTKRESTNQESANLPFGKKIIHLSTKRPLLDKNGQISGIVGNSIDITYLKTVEKEAIEAKEKSELLRNSEIELRKAIAVLGASIVHDLRMPILNISLLLDSLKRKTMVNEESEAHTLKNVQVNKTYTDEIKELILKIEDSTIQMNDLINITLKTIKSTMNGEMQEKDFIPCSIWNCINNTLIRHPISYEQRKLIKWDQSDFRFMGNEITAIRIISNLLNNSFEQIERRHSGNIFISSKEESDYNVLCFEDTAGGLSIPIENLFDGHKTTKEHGHGFGLAFCKLAMINFSGDIVAEQTSNGVIFKLSFPKI